MNAWYLLGVLSLTLIATTNAFIPDAVRQKWNNNYSLEEAMKTIGAAAERQDEEDFDLYYACLLYTSDAADE